MTSESSSIYTSRAREITLEWTSLIHGWARTRWFRERGCVTREEKDRSWGNPAPRSPITVHIVLTSVLIPQQMVCSCRW